MSCLRGALCVLLAFCSHPGVVADLLLAHILSVAVVTTLFAFFTFDTRLSACSPSKLFVTIKSFRIPRSLQAPGHACAPVL